MGVLFSYGASGERVEECLGLLEVGGVKAFSEPVVELSQELAGLGALALLLPEPGQAYGSAQLEGFRLLAPRDV